MEARCNFVLLLLGLHEVADLNSQRERVTPTIQILFYQLVSLCQTKQTLPADRVREEKEEPWLVLTSALFSMPLHDPLWLSLLGHSSTTPIRYIFSSFFLFPLICDTNTSICIFAVQLLLST